ncbi:hypothetical protein Tco_0425208 [Tanacetum coccineum]
MDIDESSTQGDMPSHYKRPHDAQDPPKDHEGEKNKKRRQKNAGESSSKKSKVQRNPHIMKEFNVLVDAEEEPEEFEYKDGSMTLFGKLVKKIFKKDKITKEDVEGPTLKLLKGTCKNSIQLEYNMDQCHLALTDKIDWSDRFHNDLNKPLPLTGPPGRKRIPVSYFFNHDLEYLKKIPTLWRPSIQKNNRDAELGIYHWDEHRHWFYKGNINHKSLHEVYSKLNIRSVQSIKVNKKFGYAYQSQHQYQSPNRFQPNGSFLNRPFNNNPQNFNNQSNLEGLVSSFMASQHARVSKFEADFKQQQGELTNKIDTFVKAINDRMMGELPSDMAKNPKLNVNPTSLVLSARSYSIEDPQCSSRIHNSINAVKLCFKQTNKFQKDQPQVKTLTVNENGHIQTSGLTAPQNYSLQNIYLDHL